MSFSVLSGGRGLVLPLFSGTVIRAVPVPVKCVVFFVFFFLGTVVMGERSEDFH